MKISKHLKNDEIDIDVSLGFKKNHTARVWTCDFTNDYISINADYRS